MNDESYYITQVINCDNDTMTLDELALKRLFMLCKDRSDKDGQMAKSLLEIVAELLEV